MLRLLFVVLMLIAPALGQTAQEVEKSAQEQKKAGRVSLNFQNADIQTVVKFMSELTGKNIIVDPNVKGSITVSSSRPVSVGEAWDIFVLALSLQGYGVVQDGAFTRIVPIQQATPKVVDRKKPLRGELAIYVHRAEHTLAQQLQQAIQPFLSQYARTAVHLQSNTLLVLDLGRNIEEIKKLLRTLDAPESSVSVEVYPLKKLNAQQVQQAVQNVIGVLQQQMGMAGASAFDKDTNSLIVVGNGKLQSAVRQVIDLLERSAPERLGRSFYIVPLKHVSVEEMHRTLSSLGKSVSPAQTPSPPPPQPRAVEQTRTGEMLPIRREQTPQTQTAPTALPPVELGEMRIGFDVGTNSLIIYATPEEFNTVKEMISRLDIKRRQVLITATVVEMSTKSALDIGIRWQVLGDKGGAGFGVGSAQDLYSSILAGNFILGFINNAGRTITIGSSSLFFPDLVLLFSLLQTGSGFNIVSNPKVLTLDNKPAVIKVGQVIPFASGVRFDINGQPIITYDYKEVGLDLVVTPSISEKDLRLRVDLSLQEIVDYVRPQIGQLSYVVPVTSNRQVSSDVVVEKGQTVIIGGLVNTKTLDTTEGVPGLMDVPLFGRLFRRDTKSEDKVSLFIFLTPYVIESPEELSNITQEHQKMAQELQKLMEKSKKR